MTSLITPSLVGSKDEVIRDNGFIVFARLERHTQQPPANVTHAVLLTPEITSVVAMSSGAQHVRRALPVLSDKIVPDAMLSRLTLPDDANPAGWY